MSRKVPVIPLLAISILLAVSLACGASAMPNVVPTQAGNPQPTEAFPTASPQPTMTPVDGGAQPTGQPQPTGVPAINESRTLTLEWPPVVHAGDSERIRLTLEVDEKGNLTPTAEAAGHAVIGQPVVIPNLFDTHNVLARARIDLAGVEVRPDGMVSQPLLPGRPVTFYWSVRAEKAGVYRGTVWFFLEFAPKNGGGSSEQAIAAMPVEIEAVSLFGLKAGPARILGVAGSFLSAILGVPFLEEVLKWVWKRARRK
jgi:hypothetical protein